MGSEQKRILNAAKAQKIEKQSLQHAVNSARAGDKKDEAFVVQAINYNSSHNLKTK